MKSRVILTAVGLILLVGCSSTPKMNTSSQSGGTPCSEGTYPPAEISGYYYNLARSGYDAIKAALLEDCVPDKKSGALVAFEMCLTEFVKDGHAEEIIEFFDAHRDNILNNVDLAGKDNEQIDKEMKRLNWHYNRTLRFYQLSVAEESELEMLLLQDVHRKEMDTYRDVRIALRAVWHANRHDLIDLLERAEKEWEGLKWSDTENTSTGTDRMDMLRWDIEMSLGFLKHSYFIDVEKHSVTEIFDKCMDDSLSDGKLWPSTKYLVGLVLVRNISDDRQGLAALEHYATRLNQISNTNPELAEELFETARRSRAPLSKYVVNKDSQGRYIAEKRE